MTRTVGAISNSGKTQEIQRRQKTSGPAIFDLICRNRLRFVDVEGTLVKGMAQAKFDQLNRYLEKEYGERRGRELALRARL